MFKTIFLTFICVALVACDDQLKSFVQQQQDPVATTAPSPTPTSSSGGSLGYHTGGLAVTSSGSQVKATLSIQPTSKRLTGSQVNAVVTFHRNRPN